MQTRPPSPSPVTHGRGIRLTASERPNTPAPRPSNGTQALRRPGRCARAAAALAACFALAWPAAPAGAFDLQGHRGARGLAPENTLAAFRTALAVGVDTLELDVHVTKDGEVVIAHDPRLNPAFTRDAQGRWIDEPGPALIELTLADLQRFELGRPRPDSRYARQWPQQRPSDGERLPTLTALFDEVNRRSARTVRFNIEIKLNPNTPQLTPPAEPYVKAVLAVVRGHGMAARVTIQSFDWSTLAVVQRLAPEVATAALSARQNFLDNVSDGRWTAGHTLAASGNSVPRLVKASGAAIWSPYHGDLTQALVSEAHALGLRVVAWTVNDPALIERLLDWGVDGLISDYPDRVRAALARRGLPLPPKS